MFIFNLLTCLVIFYFVFLSNAIEMWLYINFNLFIDELCFDKTGFEFDDKI